jgi:hypothetical protein
MNSITASNLTKSILENRALSSVLALLVWIAGVVSGSVAVMIVCGLLIYARPLLYVALIGAKGTTGKRSATRFALPSPVYKGTWADGRNAGEYATGRTLS